MIDLHVIAAGSLLEFALKDIPVPVGRFQFLNVHPLSFAEYLFATGNDQAANVVLDRPGKVSATVHAFLINELRRFFFIDYVAAINGKIYPLEVKSGASGSLKSLHLFLNTYSRTPGGMVFSTRPYEELPEKNITFIPLYFAYSATGGADIL